MLAGEFRKLKSTSFRHPDLGNFNQLLHRGWNFLSIYFSQPFSAKTKTKKPTPQNLNLRNGIILIVIWVIVITTHISGNVLEVKSVV